MTTQSVAMTQLPFKLRNDGSLKMSPQRMKVQTCRMSTTVDQPPYPTLTQDLKPSMSVEAFRSSFQDLESGSRLSDSKDIVLCGRLVSKPRESSKKLFFGSIQSDGSQVQVLSELKFSELERESFAKQLRGLRQGDIVSIRGFPGKTKVGELSIVSREITVLTPCLADIPSGRGDGKYALRDKYVRHRKRHIDLLANGNTVIEIFKARSVAISSLRSFLAERKFVEVETPVLTHSAGGAIANPFRTRAKALDNVEMSLRIAPELALKQLVIGGLDRVFEIGKVFRNEGLSPNHNPEFTSCEFYCAYADYKDLMSFTEELLAQMAKQVLGSTTTPSGIDLAGPYRRVSVVPELERIYGLEPGTLPNVNDAIRVDQVAQELTDLISSRHGRSPKHALKEGEPATVAYNCKLLDEMIGLDIEPTCVEPTFICDHPIAMSPLAKAHADNPELSQRFELFVQGSELVNSYTELNDPKEQLERFKNQLDGRKPTGLDELEVMPIDNEFCNALEYGLPPTAGWGMGIDRVVMLLTGQTSIREVILFPLLGAEERAEPKGSEPAA